MKMSIQFVLCCWTLLEMSELWMCDEREKKKEEEDKEGEKRRENYYRAGRFLQRRRFHRLFHSEQAFHFRESLFVCPILYNCCEDFEVPSFKKTRRRTKVFSTTRKDDMTFS